MRKSCSALCFLLTLVYFWSCGSAAEERYAIEFPDDINCRKGDPPSVCGRNVMYPAPRVGRRSSGPPLFSRTQRVFGLVKQPRVGRSDPSMAESDQSWFSGNPDLRQSGVSSYRLQGPGERAENYLTAHRKDSTAPWAFFVITPNFQNADQTVDNLLPQHGVEMSSANED